MANFAQAGVELIVRGANEFSNTLDSAGDSIANFGKTAAKAAVAGAAAFTAAAVGIGAASLKTAIDFESAFAGVIKTTDGLVDEFGDLTAAGEEMQQGFRDLAKEVPTAVEELFAIGELGGQLGIASDDLVDFTRTIAAMGEATNLTNEEAAVGFAQLANIMQTPQDQISNMGSAVVALGNTFATTERDILNFSSRIAGAGAVAGLTEAQVFGIGAAFSSVGIQAQAGGTATSKTLLEMNKAALEGGEKMEIFAAVAGLAADDFGAAWEEDAGAVFAGFVEGLGAAGDDAVGILDALEIKDAQAVRAFLSLAGAGDLVTEAMGKSTDAFEENTALAKEAAQRYATTESKIAIFKNTIKDVAITIGQALLPAFNALLDFGVEVANELGARLPGLIENSLIPAIKTTVIFVQRIVRAFELLIMRLTAGGLDRFLTIFEDGSTVLSSFFSDLGVGEDVALKVGRVMTRLAQNVKKFIDFVIKNRGPIIAALRNIGVALAAAFAARKIIGRIKLIITAVTALANPLVLIAAAIALFSVAWEQNWFGIQEKTQAVMDALQPIFESIQEWLAVFIPQAVQFLTDLWQSTLLPAIMQVWQFVQANLVPAFQEFAAFLQDVLAVVVAEVSVFAQEQFAQIVAWVDENWPRMQETIETVLVAIQEGVEIVLTAIQEFWATHGEELLGVIEPIWSQIQAIIEAGIQIIQQIIEAVMSAVAGDWDAVWQNISNITTVMWDLIKTTVANALLVLQAIVPAALAIIKAVIVAALIVLVQLFKTAWNFIVTGVTKALESMQMIIDATQELIKALINRGLKELRDIFEFIWNTIVNAVVSAWEGIVSLVQTGIDAVVGILRGVVSTMSSVGNAIVNAIRDGISGAWDSLVSWFKDKIGDLTSMLPFSEPKDPTSPLRGLSRAGKAIVDNIRIGLAEEMPKLQAQLVTAITVPQIITALGSVAAGPITNNNINLTMNNNINSGMDEAIFQQQTINTITDAIGLR